jgi:hypothetical protein
MKYRDGSVTLRWSRVKARKIANARIRKEQAAKCKPVKIVYSRAKSA